MSIENAPAAASAVSNAPSPSLAPRPTEVTGKSAMAPAAAYCANGLRQMFPWQMKTTRFTLPGSMRPYLR